MVEQLKMFDDIDDIDDDEMEDDEEGYTDNEHEIDILVADLRKNREHSRESLVEITKIRKRLEEDITGKNGKDFRNRQVLDEKIKIYSSIANSELQLLKHVDSSIKIEVDIRERTIKRDIAMDDANPLEKFTIADIAEKLTDIKK